MDASEFRKRGKEMVDFIADYMENIHTRRVTPNVSPGYLRNLLPDKAPRQGENWEDIVKDIDRAIMPGITHWQHPQFHAYFPAGNSYPSILGDMLSDAIGCVGFSWAASPACTELEAVVTDWLGNMIGLPTEFLHEKGIGGGVLQGSASECVLVSLLSARHKYMADLNKKYPFVEKGVLLSKLVAYSSSMAHSCVEKAGMLALVKIRQLDVDENYSLRGEVLAKAVEKDRRSGLIPFYVCATLGTTGCCSFDNVREIGQVCEKEGLWLHIDAAYAGNALICPEFQYLLQGVEHVKSLNFNPNKWMLVNFDCSVMWVRSRDDLTEGLNVDPIYLQHRHGDSAIDLRHWGIPLSRRFRALKIWFVLRSYGVEGLQKYIREHVRLAKKFESLVRQDNRFEVKGQVKMGLVCFRLKGPNHLTQELLMAINESGKLHMVPALLKGDYVIRFAICAEGAITDDVIYAWNVIRENAGKILEADYRRNLVEDECNVRNEKMSEMGEIEDDVVFDDNIKSVCKVRKNVLVKMISDPKCYNPKIFSSLCCKNRPHAFCETSITTHESLRTSSLGSASSRLK